MCEPVAEIAGAGEEVGLENPRDMAAGEAVADGPDGGLKLFWVVCVVVDIGVAGRFETDVETAPDPLEGGEGFADGLGPDAVE